MGDYASIGLNRGCRIIPSPIVKFETLPDFEIMFKTLPRYRLSNYHWLLLHRFSNLVVEG